MTPPSLHPTSIVSPEAELGAGVVIGPLCVVHDNVRLGENSVVGSHVVLGAPAAAYFDDPATYEAAPCRIGARAVIRSHCVVYAGAEIGSDFECGHHVTIREGTRIGSSVRIGTRSDLQGDLVVGDHARLHSNVFVAQRSTIEEFVWILPNVMLANDPHPPSDTCTAGPTIRRFAVISAGATIFPNVEIGEEAVVGAMALVREDIPPATLAVGIPSRNVGRVQDVVCRDGRLDQVYPWRAHFRRGYADGVLPETDG